MQKAEGTESKSLTQNAAYEAYKAGSKDGGGEEGGKKAVRSLEKKISPLFQKSLADLQVLDNIFGQVDRHWGNYFVQEKDGKFTGVTGIDNDFAFGQMKIGSRHKNYAHEHSNEQVRENAKVDYDQGKESNSKMQHLSYAADLEGNLTIPHMSDGLANAITNLTRSQLEYAVADVLNAAQIKGVWGRIQQLKTGIARDRKNPNSNRILKDDQWNEQTLEDFKNGPDNYVKTFVDELTGDQTINTVISNANDSPYLEEAKEVVKIMYYDDKLFDDVETAKKNILNWTLFTGDALMYMKNVQIEQMVADGFDSFVKILAPKILNCAKNKNMHDTKFGKYLTENADHYMKGMGLKKLL